MLARVFSKRTPCECVCTARSQNARASLAHSDARLRAREPGSREQISAPRMRTLRSRIATHGSKLTRGECVCTTLSQNAHAPLAHRNARPQTHKPRMHAHYTLQECARFAGAQQITAQNSRTTDRCTLHSPKMRALRSRISTHGSKLTNGEAASDVRIRKDLSTPPPATLTQIRTDQRRADRCGRPEPRPSAARRGCAPFRSATNETRPKGSASGARPRGKSPNPTVSAASQNNAIQRWPRAQRCPPVGPAAVSLKPRVVASAQSICKSRAAPTTAFRSERSHRPATPPR